MCVCVCVCVPSLCVFSVQGLVHHVDALMPLGQSKIEKLSTVILSLVFFIGRKQQILLIYSLMTISQKIHKQMQKCVTDSATFKTLK